LTSHRIRKNSQEIEFKKIHREKREETFRRATEDIAFLVVTGSHILESLDGLPVYPNCVSSQAKGL